MVEAEPRGRRRPRTQARDPLARRLLAICSVPTLAGVQE